MALQERELQIQEVRLELTKQISSLESKADETIGKLKRELKVLNMHVYMILYIYLYIHTRILMLLIG